MDCFVLSDGTRVTIRPIRPQDKAELTAGLGRLSQASRQKRFLSPKTHFSASELRYLTEVDGHTHAALVAEETEAPHRIVAVARYVSLPDEPGTADVAIVVGDHIQGQGLGTVLAAHLAEVAVREGVRRFSATMLGDNRAAHRLMAHLADHLERRSSGFGQSELVARLDAAA
jgi:RimJ/RimL family protein N-acetyltransferase